MGRRTQYKLITDYSPSMMSSRQLFLDMMSVYECSISLDLPGSSSHHFSYEAVKFTYFGRVFQKLLTQKC